MSSIWVVNNKLTCVPHVKTFWHMLLEIEGTVDKCSGKFSGLDKHIENDKDACDLIIRNASYFPRIKRGAKQIAFLQDIKSCPTQIDVCDNADLVVFNSNYTKSKYPSHKGWKRTDVIPIGVNEDIFKPEEVLRLLPHEKIGIFVGDNTPVKDTSFLKQLIKKRRDVGFIYVSKKGHRINSDNVVNIPGGVVEHQMARLYNSSDFIVLCSQVETLHLSSIEAALCNVPVIGNKTGWLADYFNDDAGLIVEKNISAYSDAIDAIDSKFSPRGHILKTPYTWSACKDRWAAIIKGILNG